MNGDHDLNMMTRSAAVEEAVACRVLLFWHGDSYSPFVLQGPDKKPARHHQETFTEAAV